MAEMTMLVSLDVEQTKKRRRRRKKQVCVYAKKDCTTEELQLILTELDGPRAIKRADDGRRLRTQVMDSNLAAHNTTEYLLSKKERKIKRQLLTTYLEKSRDYITAKKLVEAETGVLPIEQMLALVEVIA